MASRVPLDLRDLAIGEYRELVMRRHGITPFVHQREWMEASRGRVLIHGHVVSPDDPSGVQVRVGDEIVTWGTMPRPGGNARFLADLGSYKIGKSFGAALWATGFAAIQDARVSLVGLEYDICEPEFSYICDFLLSENGMNLQYDSYQNRPRDGKMWVDLKNGMRYEAKSWERKDTLKGKEIDAYIFCEAYMLPGMECFTTNSQNLRARRGFALFPTTPDRPWLEILHRLGHPESIEADSEWHCTCGVAADVNPFTFDPAAKTRDAKLMTKEKFAIHYLGALGDYVGRVFNFSSADRSRRFTVESHPYLFRPGAPPNPTRADLALPKDFSILGGADTGTFYTGLGVAFSPDGDAFVFDEFPNYDYTQAGEAERNEGVTIPEWARKLTASSGISSFWADANSQFKQELSQYGVHLIKSTRPLEARTEITREYFEHRKIYLAPWLRILPFEIENAQWPKESTAGGKFSRMKDRDHTLDCLEHVLSRRPRGKVHVETPKFSSAIETILGRPKRKLHGGNVHLGKQ